MDDLNCVLRFIETDKLVFPCVPVSCHVFVCLTCVPLYTDRRVHLYPSRLAVGYNRSQLPIDSSCFICVLTRLHAISTYRPPHDIVLSVYDSHTYIMPLFLKL